MSKHNMFSGILVLVVILMIVISTYMMVSYTTGVLTAAVAFASTDQIAKLQGCGVTVPAELYKFQTDIPNLLLPVLYAGLPGLMIVLSILMFIAGHYYDKGTEEHSSSETTTRTSTPDKYDAGKRVEETRTQRSSRSEGG